VEALAARNPGYPPLRARLDAQGGGQGGLGELPGAGEDDDITYEKLEAEAREVSNAGRLWLVQVPSHKPKSSQSSQSEPKSQVS
jgi:hypothetical protein